MMTELLSNDFFSCSIPCMCQQSDYVTVALQNSIYSDVEPS